LPRDAESLALELLAMRCRRGDRGALEELIRTWEPRLLYFVRRLVREEADARDVMQKTWLRVLSGIATLDDPRSLAPWLYRVARNTAYSHLRSAGVQVEQLNDVEMEVAESSAESFDFDDAARVHRGLAELSLAHREVLTLFFLEELSVEEVAGILGVPPGTVKSRLHYAKRELRKVLTEDANARR
jgi:RNA polymerase sigma-70 factor, ECF subfamily